MTANYLQMFVNEAKRASINDRGAALVLVDSLRSTADATRFTRASMALRCLARKRLRELGKQLIHEEMAKDAGIDRDGFAKASAT